MIGSNTDRWLALAVLLSVSLVACRNPDGSSRDPLVRDSSGVRIVVNFDGPVPIWQLSPAPLLDIGSETDTLTTLYQVEGAHRLDDGRIVIANRSTQELRFYDRDGMFLYAAGRKGKGPGEYDYIAWMARCGADTLYVYDIGTNRLTVLDDHGEMLRMGPLMLSDNTLPYGAASCQPGGPFVVAGWATGRPTPGRHRFPMPVGLAGLDGQPLTMIDTFPGVDRWGIVIDGVLRGSRPLPLGRNLLQTIADDHVYVGTGDVYAVNAYGLDGTLEISLRLEVTPRAVTKAVVDTYIEQQLRDMEDGERRKRRRRSLLAIDFPESLPAYAALVAARDTMLWIQDYPAPGDEDVVWRRFSPDGYYVGRATIPTALRVFEIGHGYVLGVRRDDADVEHVLLYGFESPEPDSR